MDSWLILLGIFIIAIALWKERTKDNHRASEVDNYKKIRDELVTAKKEVQVLMEQLEAASEKIVEEISVGLEEIKTHSEQITATTEKSGEDIAADGLRESDKEPLEQEISSPKAVPVNKKASPAKTMRGDNTIAFPSDKSKHRSKEGTFKSERETKTERPSSAPLPPKHQMVYAMATMGYTEEEIARQMKIGKGEVSLMLQLKRKGEN